MWNKIAQHISEATGHRFEVGDIRSVGGGCINSSSVIRDSHSDTRWFVKTNSVSQLEMFEAEYDGLICIQESDSIRVPRPIGSGTSEGKAYLVMEYLNLGGGNRASQRQLGIDLAKMHKVADSSFGWFRDNTIGSTPQVNHYSDSWVEFFRDNRLRYQLNLAATNGFNTALTPRGELLLSKLDCFFSSYHPQPSLLHGDLWSGNYAILNNKAPVIFDPAVYYGDREADIAMTELFGGFSQSFYSAYNESYPLDAGYKTRKTLYNLYHILNHLNLFGGGYLAQSQQMIENLLSET